MLTLYISSQVCFASMYMHFMFLFDNDVVNLVWGCQLFFIGRLPRWWIGECSLDIQGTGEIKYRSEVKTNLRRATQR